jgi:hypothetical protein
MNVTVSFQANAHQQSNEDPSQSVIANLHTPKARLSIGTGEAGEGVFWRKGCPTILEKYRHLPIS